MFVNGVPISIVNEDSYEAWYNRKITIGSNPQIATITQRIKRYKQDYWYWGEPVIDIFGLTNIKNVDCVTDYVDALTTTRLIFTQFSTYFKCSSEYYENFQQAYEAYNKKKEGEI